METGVAYGIRQLTLALFTTLAPAGSICIILLLIYGLFFIKDTATKKHLHHFLIVPLAFCLIGLIASTNHLGKPSNALYVLMGVGRSPLSNEVLASAVFVGMTWIYWLAGFSKKIEIKHLRIALPFVIVAGLAQIWFTSFAYNINTISTWSLIYTQVNQILSALIGGSVLFIFTLAFAKIGQNRNVTLTFITITCASTAILFVSELLQNAAFSTLTSTTTSLTEVFPQYMLFIATSTLLLLIACVLLLVFKRKDLLTYRRYTLIVLVITFLGIFIARFSFYCTYLNVGLVV